MVIKDTDVVMYVVVQASDGTVYKDSLVKVPGLGYRIGELKNLIVEKNQLQRKIESLRQRLKSLGVKGVDDFIEERSYSANST